MKSRKNNQKSNQKIKERKRHKITQKKKPVCCFLSCLAGVTWSDTGPFRRAPRGVSGGVGAARRGRVETRGEAFWNRRDIWCPTAGERAHLSPVGGGGTRGDWR